MSTCGAPRKTDGDPCEFPSAQHCPHHGDGGNGGQPGRPTTYTAEIADEILMRMAGGEPLRQVCRRDGIPPASTVRGWVNDDREGFAERYARARGMMCDHWADEIVEIADDGTGDTWVDDDGVEHVNHDVIRRSKLRVDTRKWLMSKLRPERYGKRTKLEHSGEIKGGPLVVPGKIDPETWTRGVRREQVTGPKGNGDGGR